MKRFVLSLLLPLLGLSAVWGQDDLIGVWEMEEIDSEGFSYLYVYEFREDGVFIQNEYYESDEAGVYDLECVYAFPYEVDGNVITVGEGLNWFFDVVTGEFEPYEDFAEETEEVVVEYDVTDGELTLVLSEEDLVAATLDLAYYDLELDLEEDLGLAISDPEDADQLDLSSEEIDALLEEIFLLTFIEQMEFALDLDLLDLVEVEIDEDLELDEAIVLLIEAAIVITVEEMLEEELGIEISDDLEIDLDAPETAEDFVFSLAEEAELEVDPEDIELEELNESFDALYLALEELDAALETIGETALEASDLGTVMPDNFILPNGMTAVEETSWGQLKEDMAWR